METKKVDGISGRFEILERQHPNRLRSNTLSPHWCFVSYKGQDIIYLYYG